MMYGQTNITLPLLFDLRTETDRPPETWCLFWTNQTTVDFQELNIFKHLLHSSEKAAENISHSESAN